jgi:hypothetical protein
MKKLLLVSACCLLSYMGSAQAELVIDIENVNGFAQFTLSGTDTMTNEATINNGFWMHGLIPEGIISPQDANGAYDISSGSAAFLINGISYSIEYVFLNIRSYSPDARLGFLNDSGPSHPFKSVNGDTIGLTGTILTNLSYNVFNDDTSMSLPQFSVSASKPVTLANSVNVNVGSAKIASYEPASAAADVSALNPLAALGFGLFAFGVGGRRLKK